jgi:hypothetical protein
MTLPLLALLVWCAPQGAAACSSPRLQEPESAPPAPSPVEPDPHLSLRAVLGAKVRLDPAPESEEEGPRTGTLGELVLTRDGLVEWAAIEVGGVLGIGARTVLVPMDRLRSQETEDRAGFALGMTEEELRSLPVYEVVDPGQEEQLRAALRPAEAAFELDRPEGEEPPRRLVAGTLLSLDLHAADGVFGQVSDAAFDPRTRRVDALIVARGGTLGLGGEEYLIPLEACAWRRVEDARVLAVAPALERLGEVPPLVRPEEGLLATGALAGARELFRSLAQPPVSGGGRRP